MAGAGATPRFYCRESAGLLPSTIVALDTTGGAGHDFGVIACAAATAAAFGVVAEGLRRAPRSDVTETYAAALNEPIQILGPGEEALVVLGGTVTCGDFVVATTGGAALSYTPADGATIKYIVGRMLESGVIHEKRRMFVWPMIISSS